jgi:hypothetical protein
MANDHRSPRPSLGYEEKGAPHSGHGIRPGAANYQFRAGRHMTDAELVYAAQELFVKHRGLAAIDRIFERLTGSIPGQGRGDELTIERC